MARVWIQARGQHLIPVHLDRDRICSYMVLIKRGTVSLRRSSLIIYCRHALNNLIYLKLHKCIHLRSRIQLFVLFFACFCHSYLSPCTMVWPCNKLNIFMVSTCVWHTVPENDFQRYSVMEEKWGNTRLAPIRIACVIVLVFHYKHIRVWQKVWKCWKQGLLSVFTIY